MPTEKKVPRSELDAAFDVSRSWGGMVVQGMPTTPRGYELRAESGEGDDVWGNHLLERALAMPKDRQRHSHDRTGGK